MRHSGPDPEPSWQPPPSLAATYASFGVCLAPPEGIDGRRALAGRVLFPLRDENGLFVGYAGRRTCNDGSAKYINPPNGGRFNKSRFLYGMDRAGEVAARRHHLFLVEGYKDVLAMHAAGFTETAGLCGTALGEGHVELIGRYTHRVILLLDGDEAGRKGAERAAEILFRHGFSTETLFLPEGEDPDSLARGRGPDGLAGLVARLRILARPNTEQQLRQRIDLAVQRLTIETDSGRRRQLVQILQHCVSRLAIWSSSLGRPATMDSRW